MKHPRFTIFKSEKDGQYCFNLRAKNNRIILASEGYTQKHNCKRGIWIIRICAKKNEPFGYLFEMRKTEHFWFVVQCDTNGEIIGRSETYTTMAGAKKGVKAVQKCAPIAEIVDLTKD